MLLVILLFSFIHLAFGKSSSSSLSVYDMPPSVLFRFSPRIVWFCGYRTNCFLEGSTRCDIEDITYFNCKEREMITLPASINVRSKCNHLNFQGNRLKSLKAGTFSRVDSVEELDFSNNIISSIDNHTFAPFVNLTRLRLTRNKLSKVTLGMLNGLWNLKLLELGHNNIERISPSSFRVTPNLQELRLQFNPLFQLPEDLFRFLTNLEKLDLQDTGLVQLPNNIFRPTPHLHWLSLATNMFENVPEKALAHASQLQRLDLSENEFRFLLKGAFKRLSNLSVLYLNNLDRLTWIEEGAFAGLLKLKFLTCSYNSKLHYIDEYVFGSKPSNTSLFKAPQLKRLYLRQNALRTLKSPIDEKSLSSLSFVDLSENPWECDCNLKWMTHLSKVAQANIRCTSPQQLQGRTFDTLDPSELICRSNWTQANFALVVACMAAFGAIIVVATTVVCSKKSPQNLHKREKAILL